MPAPLPSARPLPTNHAAPFSSHIRFLFWIGVTLLALAALGILFSAQLLDFIFLPLGNYLHPEWDPPANFMIPIRFMVATLLATAITGLLCLLLAGFARILRRKSTINPALRENAPFRAARQNPKSQL